MILVISVSILLGISYGMVDPIFPVFAKNVVNASYAEIGFFGLVDAIPYTFIPIIVGFLLYRYNNGKILLLGIALNVSSIYLLSSAQTILDVVILVFIAGVGYAFFWPPCNNIITNLSKNRSDSIRNRVIFHGAFTTGAVIGPLIGAYMFAYMDSTYGIIFQVSAFILAAGIITAIPLSKRRVRVVEARLPLSSLKWITKFPIIIGIVLYCSACFGIIFTTHPAFLDDSFTNSANANIELLYFVLAVARIITLLNARKLSKKPELTMIMATISIASGIMMSFIADDMAGFVFAMLLLGFGISIYLPLALEIILNRTTKTSQTVIIGTYEAMVGIGWIAGALASGIITDVWGTGVPYPIFFGIGIIMIAFAVLKRRALKMEPAR